MGIEHHHCVVAVNWDIDEILALKEWIKENEDPKFWVISEPTYNGTVTVCLIADGSNEGWAESNYGDMRRIRFIEWMDSRTYGDNSNSWKYIEVGFGELGTQLLNFNCKD